MSNAMKRVIGLRIRAARKTAGLTQEELADRLNRTTESISNLERGKSLPAVQSLAAIADQLGITLADLFVGIEAGSPDRERVALEARAISVIRKLDKTRLEIAVKQLEVLQ